MRRAASILLLLCYAALGTGVVEFLHNLEHEREDAAIAAVAMAEGRPVDQHPIHDESNCKFHSLLHAPMLAAGWVPILICLGLFVGFLSLLTPELISQRAPLRIDCRGPPAC